MINNQKELYAFINTLLKEEEFTIAKKGIWAKLTSDGLIIFDIGKEPFRGQYSMRLDFWYNDFEKMEVQNIGKGNGLPFGLGICGSPISQIEHYAYKYLDLDDKSFRNFEREQQIKKYFSDYIFPFIKKVTNLDLLVQTIKEKPVLIVHVKYDLYLYLKNKYNDSKLISIREAWSKTPELLYDLEYWKTIE